MEEKKKEGPVSVNSNRYLEFFLGGESYAVELLKVKEVITPPEMTPIPKAPAYVCGLMNLRGLVLTVIDLRKKLSIVPLKDTSQNAVIIFDLEDRMIGVVVDSIQKVLNLPDEAIKPVPDNEGASLFFKGILQNENKLSMWIDPQALLDPNVSTMAKAA
jgi:purine-binding chemotaxis protein CheW